jgi:hypothetical protein
MTVPINKVRGESWCLGEVVYLPSWPALLLCAVKEQRDMGIDDDATF